MLVRNSKVIWYSLKDRYHAHDSASSLSIATDKCDLIIVSVLRKNVNGLQAARSTRSTRGELRSLRGRPPLDLLGGAPSVVSFASRIRYRSSPAFPGPRRIYVYGPFGSTRESELRMIF
jgi:hypothetical protein